jgi:predicted RNase H-like HicB family nuclease/predicted RNA binding protein YcfA (HicA-like mRNA interferase family)
MKVEEVIKLLEADGWTLKRTSGSHRHFMHPVKPGLVTVAGKAQRDLEAEDRSEHPEAGRVEKEATMTGYVVVFEGDDESGYSAYSPDLPGVVAAGDTREETEALMREAMSEHVAILRQTGQPVPEAAATAVTIVGVPAA